MIHGGVRIFTILQFGIQLYNKIDEMKMETNSTNYIGQIVTIGLDQSNMKFINLDILKAIRSQIPTK